MGGHKTGSMDKWGIEFIQSHILKIWRLTYPHEFNGKIVLELQTHGAYDDDSKGQNDQHHEGIFQATRYRVSNCNAGR